MTDKARRKQLREKYKAAERDKRIALCPLPEDQLAALVDHVDSLVLEEGCDHTTRHAEQWAAAHGLDWEAVAEGLEEFGGYCDCEIVMNCDPGIIFGRCSFHVCTHGV